MVTQPATSNAKRIEAFRGTVLHFLDDPALRGDAALECFDVGALVLADGIVVEVGDPPQFLPALPREVTVVDYRGKLIVPGFVDTHVHYPQIDMIASHGEQLLEWL